MGLIAKERCCPGAQREGRGSVGTAPGGGGVGTLGCGPAPNDEIAVDDVAVIVDDVANDDDDDISIGLELLG